MPTLKVAVRSLQVQIKLKQLIKATLTSKYLSVGLISNLVSLSVNKEQFNK
jgi:hypothetical protein